MKRVVILYGQIRTLKETIYSIRRLFKELLNLDFYVVISLNPEDNKEEIEELINKLLEPKILLLLDNNILIDELKKINTNKKLTIDINYVNFDDYKKLPFKENYYTIEELKNNNITITEKKISDNEIMQYPFNLYIEDLLVKKIYNKIPDEIERIFLLRTDVAWFETFSDKQKNVLKKETGFREKTVLSTNYNNTLSEKNFKDLINKIEKVNEKENVIGAIYNNMQLGIRVPNLHARYFIKEDLDKYYSMMYNIDEIKRIHNKYPTLYPQWNGETLFKKIMEYYEFKFNTELFLWHYCSIIRESN